MAAIADIAAQFPKDAIGERMSSRWLCAERRFCSDWAIWPWMCVGGRFHIKL